MIPIVDDMLEITFQGTPYACSRWVDQLDQLEMWQLVTAYDVASIDGQQRCTVLLRRLTS